MVKRVSLGKWIDNSYRLRVSAPGFDVDNPSLTPNQLIFDSQTTGYGMVVQTGQAVISGAGTIVTFPSLGYIPAVHIQYVNGNVYKTFYGVNNTAVNLVVTQNSLIATGAWGSATIRYIIFSYRVKSV
jgi:hypothetical protein